MRNLFDPHNRSTSDGAVLDEAVPDGAVLDEDTGVVASATECTGLMPTPPASPQEAESYADLYPVPEVKNPVDDGLQKKKGTNAPQTP